MSENIVNRMRNLAADYEEALEQAKRFPDTKKGLRFYLDAAAIQFELSTLTTDAASKRHYDECIRLITLISSEMQRLKIVAPQPKPQPQPAAPKKTGAAPAAAQQGKQASGKAAAGKAPESAAEKELHGFDPASTRITTLPEASFADYGEMDPAVKAVVDALETAYKRRKYPSLDQQMPNIKSHILLYGPPGGGKSHFCSALGRYAMEKFNSPFYLVYAKDIKHSLSGVAEKRLGALFAEVRQNGGDMPVVCIDEIDSICPSRDSSANNAAHVNSLVTEFLQNIEGVGGSTNAIIVGATNYPWKLDAAMRSRLKNSAYVGLPSEQHIYDYLNKQIRRYLGEDEEFAERMLTMCAKRLEHASYRNLGWFRDQISTIAFNNTIEKNPDDTSLATFVPVSEEQIEELLSRTVIEYDEAYIERLLDTSEWSEA